MVILDLVITVISGLGLLLLILSPMAIVFTLIRDHDVGTFMGKDNCYIWAVTEYRRQWNREKRLEKKAWRLQDHAQKCVDLARTFESLGEIEAAITLRAEADHAKRKYELVLQDKQIMWRDKQDAEYRQLTQRREL